MNLETKIKKLEEISSAKDKKYFVMMFGADGRVTFGSTAIMGMTREEVKAFTGDSNWLEIIPASEDMDGVK